MAETSEKKWSHERKKLLLEVRLRHEPDFCAKKKKRSAIWEQIMREIKEVEGTFPFSRDEATRCFINLMGTYKRIKKRNNTSGESSTNWEFFDVMDEVFGSRSSVQVPSEMLESSLESLVEDLTSDSPLTPTDSHAPMNLDATPSENTTQRFAIKRKRCEVLEFLSKESEADAKVMKKLLDIEAEKIAVEKEKVAELKEIRALFQRIVDRSQ
ncbi:uncharacterized protein LOC128924147 [Zeugodacus cucurbitae]|uniref:uncharacterized protein LOC128920207 n=1 Tax=Zeugodacus cucurbitae TaxID=28588 RepID=UPI0023D96035|nr:uncharacterized protein LOC128920207 [Zeugodacus cucurbitae]XP_054092031.1 uncharacterized protein LOC128924147 [Zeugodacus cucurbitae]